jgi:hypothetical protein
MDRLKYNVRPNIIFKTITISSYLQIDNLISQKIKKD